MNVEAGQWRMLSDEKMMTLNCGARKKLLRVPWTARRANQSILMEINHWKEWCWCRSCNTLPPDEKNQLIRKYPDARKDWRQEEKGMTEDRMVAWHHWLNGHKFEQVPGIGEGKGSMVYFSLWGRKGSGMIERLNNNSTLQNYALIYSFFCPFCCFVMYFMCIYFISLNCIVIIEM